MTPWPSPEPTFLLPGQEKYIAAKNEATNMASYLSNGAQRLNYELGRINGDVTEPNKSYLLKFKDYLELNNKDTRPQKELVLRKLRLKEIDGVAVWALDRWGRTMSELVLEFDEFTKTGQTLISLKEGLDLSTASGRLMANVWAEMANFERDRIRERTMLGLARARAQGKKLGRPRKT